MVNMNLTADLVCINLSGVEMLTDVLFYVLKFSNTYLRMVKKAVFTGNHTTGCFLNSPQLRCEQIQEERINVCESQLHQGSQRSDYKASK